MGSTIRLLADLLELITSSAKLVHDNLKAGSTWNYSAGREHHCCSDAYRVRQLTES
ncbi:hypothetical protein ABT120_19965 [Nonomuraea angiospora]|uniref:hypothetical protein n=1 Tax=Nonomuraea angiospora TaxID=46172 RepID=UPI003331A769